MRKKTRCCKTDAVGSCSGLGNHSNINTHSISKEVYAYSQVKHIVFVDSTWDPLDHSCSLKGLYCPHSEPPIMSRSC